MKSISNILISSFLLIAFLSYSIGIVMVNHSCFGCDYSSTNFFINDDCHHEHDSHSKCHGETCCSHIAEKHSDNKENTCKNEISYFKIENSFEVSNNHTNFKIEKLPVILYCIFINNYKSQNLTHNFQNIFPPGKLKPPNLNILYNNFLI